MWARPGALAACVALAFAFGCAHARSPASLEDTLSHLEYARLFDAFHSWARRHHRTYPTAAKERSALAAFYLNRKAVAECNANSAESGFICSMNGFSDETHAQFLDGRLRDFGDYDKGYSKAGTHPVKDTLGNTLAPPPGRMDWVERGKVTPVSDQGACASSWAFAAVSSLESLNAIMGRDLVHLSVQQMLSCDGHEHEKGSEWRACAGGLPHNALGWVQKHGGLSRASAYSPYLSGNTSADMRCLCCGGTFGLCAGRGSVGGAHTRECEREVTCGGYFEVPHDEGALLDAVSQQPVVTGVDASAHTFMLYRSGVYSAAGHGWRSHEINHALLVVGYGEEDGVKYWKLKNSWGTDWGENGFLRLKRGERELGVASYSVYPSTPTVPLQCAAAAEGDVQLLAYPRGVVTTFTHGAWRALCAEDKHVRERTGGLVCRQLGYSHAHKVDDVKTARAHALTAPQLRCSSTAASLVQCDPIGAAVDSGADPCPSGEIMEVECEGARPSDETKQCGTATMGAAQGSMRGSTGAVGAGPGQSAPPGRAPPEPAARASAEPARAGGAGRTGSGLQAAGAAGSGAGGSDAGSRRDARTRADEHDADDAGGGSRRSRRSSRHERHRTHDHLHLSVSEHTAQGADAALPGRRAKHLAAEAGARGADADADGGAAAKPPAARAGAAAALGGLSIAALVLAGRAALGAGARAPSTPPPPPLA